MPGGRDREAGMTYELLPFGPLVWQRPPAAPALRSYQEAALAELEAAYAAGRRAPLLVLPTGGGKTLIVAAMIRRELDRGAEPSRVLFCVPRRELIAQSVEKLRAVGVEPGVICGDMDAEAGLGAAVQVCSVDTLHARVQRRASPRMALDLHPRVVVVDEAHLSITKPKVDLLRRLGAERVLGVTATPTRKDGRALGVLYDVLLEPATVASLTAARYLVPVRYWSWPTPDLRGVRIDRRTRDYDVADLAVAVNPPKLLG